MFGLGTTEIVIIIGILVLIFGPKKIPEIARSIGDAIRQIRGAFSSAEERDTTEK